MGEPAADVRPRRLVGASLAALRDLDRAAVVSALAQPGSAIDLLAADFTALWDGHLSGDWEQRRTGLLELGPGGYVQWIGYSDRVVVEVSSNTYLRGSARLTEHQEALLVRAGFQRPDERESNFWISVDRRDALGAAAFSVVAALTAAFGVYAP